MFYFSHPFDCLSVNKKSLINQPLGYSSRLLVAKQKFADMHSEYKLRGDTKMPKSYRVALTREMLRAPAPRQ